MPNGLQIEQILKEISKIINSRKNDNNLKDVASITNLLDKNLNQDELKVTIKVLSEILEYLKN